MHGCVPCTCEGHAWTHLGASPHAALSPRTHLEVPAERDRPCPAAADVNRHPSQVVAMMRPLLPLLHPGGAVILTLKAS